MAKQDLKETTYQAHMSAIKRHELLLQKLHLDSDKRLDEAKTSFERVALTLEEYLKVLGIP